MAGENQKLERIFKKLEDQDRKIYLLNESVTSLKQEIKDLKTEKAKEWKD